MHAMDNGKGRRDRGGMTLVEMMIALTVFGMIMAVVMGFLVDVVSKIDDSDLVASLTEKIQQKLSQTEES